MWDFIIPIVGFIILALITIKVMPKDYEPKGG